MIQSAADNQSKLLNVINEIFTYVIDPYSSKKVIRINPKLTEESLQKAIENTRKFIVELYLNSFFLHRILSLLGISTGIWSNIFLPDIGTE